MTKRQFQAIGKRALEQNGEWNGELEWVFVRLYERGKNKEGIGRVGMGTGKPITLLVGLEKCHVGSIKVK